MNFSSHTYVFTWTLVKAHIDLIILGLSKAVVESQYEYKHCCNDEEGKNLMW